MRIAVFGVGAVGGYFGGRLTQTDHDVFFIARGSHLNAIQMDGLRVDSEGGDFIAHPTRATPDPAQIGEVDAVILATKAWQVHEAAEAMQPLIGAHTMIVPLLNGVEAPIKLSQVIDPAHVLGGFCRVLSRMVAPGHIEQGGTPPFVAMGELNAESSDRVTQLAQVMESAGITVQLPQSIQAAMWQKLLFIASFGGVGALTRQPVGILRDLPETRTLLESAMQEVIQVAQARDIPLTQEAVTQGMSLVDNLPYEATASMQRDILAGRPSELDAQNGAVVRLGADVGIDAALHRVIYHSLLPSEMQARQELSGSPL